MNKILISIVLLICINVSYAQVNEKVNLNLTAGDHLKYATMNANIGIAMMGIGTVFMALPIAMDLTKKEATAFYLFSGVSFIIGISFNISAWQQFGKAGRKLNKL